MKKILLATIGIIAGIAGLTASENWTGVKIYNKDHYVRIYSDNFDSLAFVKSYPHVDEATPVASKVPNTTIAEIKQMITSLAGDSQMDASLVGEKEDGSHYIIRGHVISTDRDNSLYRTLVIQDETGAIPIMVSLYNIWRYYPIGQEVVVDVTGLYIGKYMDEYEIGGLADYGNDEVAIGYLDADTLRGHMESNGKPHSGVAYVDYAADMKLPSDTPYCIRISLKDVVSLSLTSEAGINLMGQLVELADVAYVNGGKEPFAWFLTTVNQPIVDCNGNELITRNSGYSVFFDEILPTGNGALRGILKAYTSYGLYLVFRDASDIMFPTFTYRTPITDCWTGLNTYSNGMSGYHIPTQIIDRVEFFSERIDGPTGTGKWDDPYTVPQILKGSERSGEAWVTGYIVGYVNTDHYTYMSKESVVFGAEGAVTPNFVLAASPDEKDWGKCMPVQLSPTVRADLSLALNPGNIGRQVCLKGEVGTRYIGEYGLRNCDKYRWGDMGEKDEIEGATKYLVDGMDNFTIETIEKPDDISDIWSWNFTYGAIATAYYQGECQVADAYLVSPVLTPDAEEPVACFTQYLNYLNGNERADYVNVCVREAGSSEWVVVNVDKWPHGNDWNASVNCYIDLSAFAGKPIQIGFHYVSTSQCSPTWEVKNLFIRQQAVQPLRR